MFNLEKELEELLKELKGESEKESMKNTFTERLEFAKAHNLSKEELYDLLTKEECLILLEQASDEHMKDTLTIGFLMSKLEATEVKINPMDNKSRDIAIKIMMGKLPSAELISKTELIIKL